MDTVSVWIMSAGLSSRAKVVLEWASAVNYFYLLCQCFHSTLRDYLKGLEVLKNYYWWCKVYLCSVYRFCELGQFHRPWLMANDILFQILKLWDFVENFGIVRFKKKIEYFDIYQNLYFQSNPYYLRGWIYIPLRFVRSS